MDYESNPFIFQFAQFLLVISTCHIPSGSFYAVLFGPAVTQRAEVGQSET